MHFVHLFKVGADSRGGFDLGLLEGFQHAPHFLLSLPSSSLAAFSLFLLSSPNPAVCPSGMHHSLGGQEQASHQICFWPSSSS